MAHFAKIENNIVTQVIVVGNESLLVDGVESEQAGIDFCKTLFGQDTEWVQTSYNNSFRKHYAGIGYTYSKEHDAFIAPQPFPSWTLDENFDWIPPEPMPNNTNVRFVWNEEMLTWDTI